MSPNQVTPKTPPVFGPVTPQAAPAASPAAPRQGAFKGADLEVTLDGVVVDGAFDELRGALDTLWSRVKGRRLSLAELQQAIDDYQQAYEAAGYLLARVITPPQALTQRGLLRLVVIDGFVESVETAGVPERLRQPVADRLAPIVGTRHLQAAAIERQLLLLGNMAGVRLRSALVAGTQRGGVRLIVDGGYDAATGSLQLDNRLPRTLGTWELAASVGLNQVFGFGEKLYASGLSARRSQGEGPPVRTLVAGAALPLGVDGFAVNLELTRSQSRQKGDTDVPATQGRFSRTALRTSYPWEMSRRRRIDLRASVEHVEQSIVASAFDQALNRDDYRVLRLGTELGALLDDGSSLQAAGFVSRGLGGRDSAAAQASGIPLSRIGASPRFTKLDFTLQYARELGEATQLAVLAQGQFGGGKPLLKPEQLSLEGGSDILSFPAGSLAVDSGAAARVELSSRYALPLGAVKAGVFAGFGTGTRSQPTAVEAGSVRASSFGVSFGSLAADLRSGWTPYFHLDCALRRSSDPLAAKGWTVMATIGVKS